MAISYSTPFLSSASNAVGTVTNTGIAGGTYSSMSGLIINPSTGAINLIDSVEGTYVVTYTEGLTTETTLVNISHSFDDIQDLYNQTLVQDKQYVDEVIAEIKAAIKLKIDASAEPILEYNSEPILGVLEPVQQDRIRDQVIMQLRNMGIRVNAGGVGFYIPYIPAGSIEPTPNSINFIFIITWLIRDHREFMKAYV